jgi:hypothetical protein
MEICRSEALTSLFEGWATGNLPCTIISTAGAPWIGDAPPRPQEQLDCSGDNETTGVVLVFTRKIETRPKGIMNKEPEQPLSHYFRWQSH